VRNCEDFIKECIDSIVSQDYPHELMEQIFVDGASEDKTLSIIKNCAENRNMNIKIFQQERKGLGWARNMVVDHASGDYIVWVDGDMVLSTDYIGRLIELMERNPDVGIAKGKYNLTPGANWIATLEIYSRVAAKMVDFNSEVKTGSKSMGTAGCIYRVKAIRQVGGFDTKIKGYGEDEDAEYRIRAAGWRLATAEPQYRDYERRGLTWKLVWRKFVQRGYSSHYFFSRKKKGVSKLYKWTPIAACLSGLVHSLMLYKLTHQKKVFLLPIQYVFKTTAWWIGFLNRRFE
jgi:GT2 family glycosyltransferase